MKGGRAPLSHFPPGHAGGEPPVRRHFFGPVSYARTHVFATQRSANADRWSAPRRAGPRAVHCRPPSRGAGTGPAALRTVSATPVHGSRRTPGFPPRRGHLGTGSRWWNPGERRERPVLPVGARRPPDKAREGGAPTGRTGPRGFHHRLLGVLPAARLRRAVPAPTGRTGQRSAFPCGRHHLAPSAFRVCAFHHGRGCAGGPHHEGLSRWGPAQLAGGGRHAYRRPGGSGARLSDFAPVRPSGFLPRATRGRRRARARPAPCRKSRPRPQTSCLDFDTRAGPPASRFPPLQRSRARCAT